MKYAPLEPGKSDCNPPGDDLMGTGPVRLRTVPGRLAAVCSFICLRRALFRFFRAAISDYLFTLCHSFLEEKADFSLKCGKRVS